MNRSVLFTIAAVIVMSPVAQPQEGFFTKEDVIKYTPEWKGERFADGRPKVPDTVLERMKNVTLEEAWAVLRSAGYNHQYEDGWLVIHPDQVLVGRALTAEWMPGRPDVQRVVEEQGKLDHRIGAQNAWPVDMLQLRDVYVCDHFELKQDGPSIGDNVGNAIYARTGNGIVYNGAVRDIEGLKELPNFVSFVRFYDPSHHFGSLSSGARLNSTMVGINCPTRIGPVMVMPGDVVLGKDGGVIFGHQRLREKKYTAGQIDARWSEPIERDFTEWLRANENSLPVDKQQIEEILKERSQNQSQQ
jgi:regulator of RNase E activity RraA